MLPYTTIVAAPWFNAYGATLDDPTSFRHVIGLVEREVVSLRHDLKHYEVFPDVMEECNAALAAADDLLTRMRVRLAAIIAPAVTS